MFVGITCRCKDTQLSVGETRKTDKCLQNQKEWHTFAMCNAETQSLTMNQNFDLQYSKMTIVACDMVT